MAARSQREGEVPIAGVDLPNVQTGKMWEQGADTHDAAPFRCTMHREAVGAIGAATGRYRRISFTQSSEEPRNWGNSKGDLTGGLVGGVQSKQ